jgi:hypothetical protein
MMHEGVQVPKTSEVVVVESPTRMIVVASVAAKAERHREGQAR